MTRVVLRSVPPPNPHSSPAWKGPVPPLQGRRLRERASGAPPVCHSQLGFGRFCVCETSRLLIFHRRNGRERAFLALAGFTTTTARRVIPRTSGEIIGIKLAGSS